MRIKKNEYSVPSKVSTAARNLINRLLRSNPTDRPNMDQIMEDPFFTAGNDYMIVSIEIVLFL